MPKVTVFHANPRHAWQYSPSSKMWRLRSYMVQKTKLGWLVMTEPVQAGGSPYVIGTYPTQKAAKQFVETRVDEEIAYARAYYKRNPAKRKPRVRRRGTAGRFVREEFAALRKGSTHIRTARQAVAAGLSRARRAGVRVPKIVKRRENPPALPVSYVLSDRALEIAYTHKDDGRDYKHKFKRGVRIQLLADGSARLYRPDGRPLWHNFRD